MLRQRTHRHFYSIFLLSGLQIVSVLLLRLAGTRCFAQPSNDEITTINTFSGCTTRFINFLGLDVNYGELKQPILFVCYFSFQNSWHLWPCEWKTKQTKTMFHQNNKQ